VSQPETHSNKQKRQPDRFKPVLDGRKRKIPGLWERRGAFYAQIRVRLPSGATAPRRIRLEATTVAAAREEIEGKRVDKRRVGLALRPKCPTLGKWIPEYLTRQRHADKRPATRDKEIRSLRRWEKILGAFPIDRIGLPEVDRMVQARSAQGISGRTINLDVIVLRNVLKDARTKWPHLNVPRPEPLKHKAPPDHEAPTRAEIQAILKACKPTVTKNADLARNYFAFLAYSGAREREALKVRWDDVDLAGGRVTIGSSGDTKSGKSREVNLNSALRDLLERMAAGPRVSEWLFPSPQRGARDIPAKSLRETLNLVRAAAGLPWLAFHDFRRYFATQCIESKVDAVTVGKWLGHQDQGYLVLTRYVRARSDYMRSEAGKVSL
jgi:integrase